MRELLVFSGAVFGTAAVASLLAAWRGHAEAAARAPAESSVPAAAGQRSAVAPPTPTAPADRSARTRIDPFFPERLAAGPATVPPPVVTAPAPPQVPPFAYRYFGRMSAPGVAAAATGANGQAVDSIYLERGDRLVKAEAGLELEDGYRIESVSAARITVSHPLLAQPLTMQLPAAATVVP